VLHEGPMAYQSGAKTFVVSPERGTVTTRCGTRDESVIADAEGYHSQGPIYMWHPVPHHPVSFAEMV
jgi:hypothetical protein